MLALLLGACRFFLVGMVLHFLVHTRFTFGLGWDINFVWAWKEMALVALFFFAAWEGWTYRSQMVHWLHHPRIFTLISLFLLTCLWQGIVVLVGEGTVRDLIISMRYSMLGYITILAMALGVRAIYQKKLGDTDAFAGFLGRWRSFFCILLLAALAWRVIAVIKPGTFTHLFGYDRTSVEGDIGTAPPVNYFTNLTHGYVRSTFLFERPIHRGFYLIAFFPLFFVLMIRPRWGHFDAWLWLGIYSLNVFLTFSRAAWLAYAVLLGVMIIWQLYGLRFFLSRRLWTILPFVLIGSIIAIKLFIPRSLRQRSFSTTGHIQFTLQGLAMVAEKPLRGRGPSTAGPGSFHRGDLSTNFNPENQFLQLFIEFGIVGGVLWTILFFFMSCGWMLCLSSFPKKNLTDPLFQVWVALSLGGCGLAICGLFLHSFVDRMIVYPYAVLYGLSLGHVFAIYGKSAFLSIRS
ncbi:MAG: O-antigen ligase family protein [Candidatus Absconditabacterales bacterium]|nr:O-antigen ligase family protein [Candidatus Absconditabacterales bacterium]